MDWINFDIEVKNEDKDASKDEQSEKSSQEENVIRLFKHSFMDYIFSKDQF